MTDDSIEDLIELLLQEDSEYTSPDFNLSTSSLNREVELKVKQEIKDNSQKIESLEEKIDQLTKELAKAKVDHHSKSSKNNLKDELEKHSQKFDFLRILIMTGDTYCEVKGVAFKLYADFISLLAKENRVIKIPLNKIVAFEKQKKDNLKQKKRTEQDDKKEVEQSSSVLNNLKSLKSLDKITEIK